MVCDRVNFCSNTPSSQLRESRIRSSNLTNSPPKISNELAANKLGVLTDVVEITHLPYVKSTQPFESLSTSRRSEMSFITSVYWTQDAGVTCLWHHPHRLWVFGPIHPVLYFESAIAWLSFLILTFNQFFVNTLTQPFHIRRVNQELTKRDLELRNNTSEKLNLQYSEMSSSVSNKFISPIQWNSWGRHLCRPLYR